MVDRWLTWAGMKVKVQKCYSIGIQGSSGKIVDPSLQISAQKIPFANKPLKFLGIRIEVPRSLAKSSQWWLAN